ncbi:hypothetical protein Tco_1161946, partial [Tanacetum coccineum]
PHKLKRLRKVGLARMTISSEDEGLGDQEDASKQERKIGALDVDEGVTLVDDAQMFDTDVFDGEEVFAGHDVAKKEVSIADSVITASEGVTTQLK